jgi:hypothetical protein
MATRESIPSIPDEFAASYRNFARYPLNHTSRAAYIQSSLESSRRRLEGRRRDLVQLKENIKVPFRDISDDGKVSRANAFDDAELRECLGDVPVPPTPDAPSVAGNVLTLRDPRCRFV